MHDYLQSWSEFDIQEPPFLLTGDETLLGDRERFRLDRNWHEYLSSKDFHNPLDSRFHMGLLPMPHVGNLSTEQIYILMLNPGFKPDDYFGESEVANYRLALEQNLRQSNPSDFMFLDPQFSWHSGYDYWNSKFRGLITFLSARMRVSDSSVRQLLRSKVAVLQRMPYHSAQFKLPAKVSRGLRSTRLAVRYVEDILVPKAKSDEILLLALRASKTWGLPDCDNIVAYVGGETRGAHLGIRTRGGQAIARFLESR